VYDVVTGGPAAEAGIQVGDQVLAIDDQPVRDLLAVRAKLKDPATLNVKLRVHSKSGDRDVTLTLRDLT
jgi:C-terminal processing protease CtpA/Prc